MEFGSQGYDYVGNDTADLAAMRSARKAWLVAAKPSLARLAATLGNVTTLLQPRPPTLRDFLVQLRFHQWLKNVLVFLPLLAAHRITEAGALADAVLAFMAFCACASGVYVLNDLMDLPADRRHPRKRTRPLASGAIPARTGLLLAGTLPVVAILLATRLPYLFMAVLVAYYFVSLNYNLWAKNVAVLDTLVLAGLYTLRIIAGAAAVSVVPSFWLLAFSMFFFLSIAMAKRYSELIGLELADHEMVPGRQYNRIDLNTILSEGAASGYAAVLVLALYINSEEVRTNYSRPEVIWLICPLMLYWINKLWLNTQRREMHDDPLVWALENRVSRGIAIMSVLLLFVAI
jgi:4-hydroxybenzoate polyprenyltransferase